MQAARSVSSAVADAAQTTALEHAVQEATARVEDLELGIVPSWACNCGRFVCGLCAPNSQFDQIRSSRDTQIVKPRDVVAIVCVASLLQDVLQAEAALAEKQLARQQPGPTLQHRACLAIQSRNYYDDDCNVRRWHGPWLFFSYSAAPRPRLKRENGQLKVELRSVRERCADSTRRLVS